jgi:cysteine desulfurase
LVVGLGLAVQQAVATQPERSTRLAALRDRLWQQLQAVGGIERNGAATPRLAHNLSVRVEGVDGAALHSRLRRHLAVSSGSACAGGEPSHVLQSLGLSRQQAAASIRFGLGADTTAAEIDAAATVVQDVVTALRRGPTG